MAVKEKHRAVIFGIHPVMEKLTSAPEEVLEVFVAGGRQGHAIRSVEREATKRGLPVRYLTSAELDRWAHGGRHQGVVAKVASFCYSLLDDLLGEVSARSGDDLILVLDSITDPRNFGALLRTAEGVGIHDVVLPKDRSVGVTPTVVKTSAGAVHYLKVYRVTNLRSAIQSLKQKGYWVIGLDAQAQESVYGRTYPRKLVVVLGSEGKGIRPLIREECDFLVSIPMRGRVRSLNVAVSGGVFLYELLRQRDVI